MEEGRREPEEVEVNKTRVELDSEFQSFCYQSSKAMQWTREVKNKGLQGGVNGDEWHLYPKNSWGRERKSLRDESCCDDRTLIKR